jgi:calcineurin-like phosphoesterase family protein
MSNKFFCSDHHFGHANICKFTNEDGTKLRPWDDIQEHDEELVKRHNSVVKDTDTVYFGGDVAINRKHLHTIARLRGRKVLIKGNHDIFDLHEYQQYFVDVRAYLVNPKEKFIFCHIPIHYDNFGRMGINIHGHTHGNVMKDSRYFSVCMEQVNYTPIEQSTMLEIARTRLKNERILD